MTSRRLSVGSVSALTNSVATAISSTTTSSASPSSSSSTPSQLLHHDTSLLTQSRHHIQQQNDKAQLLSSTTALDQQLSLSSQHQQQRFVREGRRSSTTKSIQKISQHALHVRILRLAWCAAILFGERLVYSVMLRRCFWAADPAWPTDEASVKDQYRIAIVADPQLTDWFSYKQKGLVLTLVEFYTDLFMSRSFDYFHYLHQPDAVLFLGDLLDGGRETTTQETYYKNLQRFHRVFQTGRTALNIRPVVEYTAKPFLPSQDTVNNDSPADATRNGGIGVNEDYGTHTGPAWHNGLATALEQDHQGSFYHLAGGHIPTSRSEREQMRMNRKSLRLYMAGNHDIGFGDTTIPRALGIYRDEFGPLNYKIDVGGHQLVMLDTVTLSAEDKSALVKVEAQRMLEELAQQDIETGPPRILFTHIPLYRPPHTFCGVERETTSSIEQGRGRQFQNLVDPELSQEILEKVQPRVVFSGDDHDWCRVHHPMKGASGSVVEVTVPTFSFAQGVYQPGLVMLSLYNPSAATAAPPLSAPSNDASNTTNTAGGATLAYRSCMLPVQLHIYFSYGAFLALTLAWTLIQRCRWLQHRSSKRYLLLNSLPLYRSESNKDALPPGTDNSSHHDHTLNNNHDDGQDNESDPHFSNDKHIDIVRLNIPATSEAQERRSREVAPATSSCLVSRLYWRCVWLDIWHIASLPIILYVMLLIL